MGIFSQREEQEELVLVFDIGSSSVGGALLKLQKSKIPKIITAFREPIPVKSTINVDQFLTSTVKTLEEVSDKIYMAHQGAPKRIFCVLSSPWYTSQIRTISLKKNTSFVFNKTLADGLIQKEIALFEEEYLTQTEEAGKARPIELKTMNTILNGYATTKPFNQKAKEISMSIFISIGREQVLKQMEEAINSHFNYKNIRFSSFVMSSFTVVRDMFLHQENFLLVDIGGEVTDISMIKKDMLCQSISFPIGHHAMTRGVAEALSCSLADAKSFISLYKDEHAASGTIKKLEPIINKLKMEWLKQFQDLLANLSNDISIPSTIFLTIDPSLATFFSDVIKNEQFSQYTLTDSKFAIIILSTELFHGIASFEEDIIRDPFLILESVYINRFLNNPGKTGQV